MRADEQHLPGRPDGRGQDVRRASCSRSASARRSSTPTTRSSARPASGSRSSSRSRAKPASARAKTRMLAELVQARQHRARDRRRRRALRARTASCSRENGIVVYLRAASHDLWHRTRHDRNRPLLQTGGAAGEAGASSTPSATRCTGRWPTSSSIPASQSLGSLVHKLERQLVQVTSAAARPSGSPAPAG